MKKLLYFLLIQVFFISCSKDNISLTYDPGKSDDLIELSDLEYASIAFDSPEELTEDMAKSILVNFIESEQDGHSFTRTSTLPSINLIKKRVLQADESIMTKTSAAKKDVVRTSIYEFEICDGENQGLALVSADERSPALIAYIPKFDESTFSISGAHIMFENAQASHLSDIAFIESLKDSLREKTYSKISKKLNIPVKQLSYELIKDKIHIDGEVITRALPISNPPTRIYSFVYPLITTKWDQNAPYNSRHPDIVTNKITGAQGKPFAGCVEVAIAQVFAYCEVTAFRAQGPAVDWRVLKANPKISTNDPLNTRNMVGNLMLEIFQQAGGYYAWNNVGIHSGTPTPASKFVPYIQRIISTANQQAYNWTSVQNSLTALQPVIIWGAEHCWILDGYAVCKKSGSVGTSQYDTYVTANLGWGGSNDGYYKLNDNYHTNFIDSYDSTKQTILPFCKRK